MRRVRITALGLTFVTGFTALVYEVTWQKYLATLLGSHSEATAAVLGLFLGGLAVGYALFGWLTRRIVRRAEADLRTPRLLLFYGAVEAGIGAFALIFPVLFGLCLAASARLPHGSSGFAFAMDVALSSLLIGPPAVLMGGTIPILTQALTRDLTDATRLHATVYGLNTVGAFAGALAAGFWLISSLGLVAVLAVMGVINLLVGSAFAVLDEWMRRQAILRPAIEGDDSAARVDVGIFALIALLVGFAMMTIQNVLIRVGSLSLGSSQFTFSMIVAVFVLCIALGSLAVSFMPRVPRWLLVFDLWALAAALYLLYWPMEDAPYWAHRMRSLFPLDRAAFFPYLLATLGGLLAVLALPVALSGAALPLIFHEVRRGMGGLGDAAGRLYGWNTLGSLLGALFGGYALFFWFDLDQIYRLGVAAVAVAAVLTAIRPWKTWNKVIGVAMAAALLAHLALIPGWEPERLTSGLFRVRESLPITYEGPDAFFGRSTRREIEFHTDDPIATISVVRWKGRLADGRDDLAIFSNGKSDSALYSDYVTMGLIALVPALLAEKVERAFVIGLGTGVTAGELAALHTAPEVVIAEISPGVIEAAPMFAHGNQNPAASDAVRIVRSDAYRALLRSSGTFDVIASEPSNPWVTGVEMLYSREFLTAARERLSPGGVYAQWFHTYETDRRSMAMILRTYASVFEYVAVWYLLGDDLLLLGFRDGDLATDLSRLSKRAQRSDFTAGLHRCGIRSLPALLAHELLPLGVTHATPLPGELHTLLHPRLSDLAARAFFTGQRGRLPFTSSAADAAARTSLAQRYFAQLGDAQEFELGVFAYETCRHRPRECATILARWALDNPESALRDRLISGLTGSVARRVTPSLLSSLGSLHSGEIGSAGEDPVAWAIETSRRYSSYYHHAAPFDPGVLAEVWRKCESDPRDRQRCREASVPYQLSPLGRTSSSKVQADRG